MIEAASDPFPPPDVLLHGGGGEVVDICDDRGVPTSEPFVLPGQTLSRFTTSSNISVPQYVARRRCVTGFSDSTIPSAPDGLSAPEVTISGYGPSATFTISGIGFGTLPSPLAVPTHAALPYIAIHNESQRWTAGNSLNGDSITLNISSWSDNAITIDGFNTENLIMKRADKIRLWVCNPSSGNCREGAIKIRSPDDSPQLNLSVINTEDVRGTFDVRIDNISTPMHDENGHRSTGWVTLAQGTHVVSEIATSSGFFRPNFGGACASNGSVDLRAGDHKTCTIVNSLCSRGQHCCNPTTRGCRTRCVSDATACQPLCPTGSVCCGHAGSNGACDGECKGPRQECR
jgi:hypothetical protein